MKFGKVAQVGLVSVFALALASLFTACTPVNTGFMFVATNRQTPGQIEVYKIDPIAGYLETIPTSPFPSGGRNPIAEAVSPDFKNLYVINEDDNNIVQFGVGSDGKLYAQSTINTPGAFPLALAINAANTFVYAVDTLQPIAGCTPNNACPGAIAGYAVTSSATAATAGSFGEGSLGQVCATIAPATTPTCTLGNPVANSNNQTYVPLQLSAGDNTDVLAPTAITLLANGSFAYVTAHDAATNAGYLFGFTVNSDGSLSPLTLGQCQNPGKPNCTRNIPMSLGTDPVALASDPSSSYIYVVDKANNSLSSYSVQSSGSLSLQSSVATGGAPTALTQFGNFLYVTNSGDSNVTSYSLSSGSLTRLATNATDTNPIAITVDPKKVGFLYTVNFLGGTVSGFQIDATSGALINTQNTPYPSLVQPTAIAGVPHGGTATAK